MDAFPGEGDAFFCEEGPFTCEVNELPGEGTAAAVAKATATRKARGTTSKKQKLAIKGNVIGVNVTPVTAPPVATPPAPAQEPVSPAPTAPSTAAPAATTTK